MSGLFPLNFIKKYGSLFKKFLYIFLTVDRGTLDQSKSHTIAFYHIFFLKTFEKNMYLAYPLVGKPRTFGNLRQLF